MPVLNCAGVTITLLNVSLWGKGKKIVGVRDKYHVSCIGNGLKKFSEAMFKRSSAQKPTEDCRIKAGEVLPVMLFLPMVVMTVVAK